MDLTKEILFNTSTTTLEPILESEEHEHDNKASQELNEATVNVLLEKTEFLLEHGLDQLIVDSSKLKDLTLKAVLTKYKDNLSIVPSINSDFITIVTNQTEVCLDTKASPGNLYTIYTLHQTKG